MSNRRAESSGGSATQDADKHSPVRPFGHAEESSPLPELRRSTSERFGPETETHQLFARRLRVQKGEIVLSVKCL